MVAAPAQGSLGGCGRVVGGSQSLSWGRGKCGSRGTSAGSEGKGGDSDGSLHPFCSASRSCCNAQPPTWWLQNGTDLPRSVLEDSVWNGLGWSPQCHRGCFPRETLGQSPPSSARNASACCSNGAGPLVLALLPPSSPFRTLVIGQQTQDDPISRSVDQQPSFRLQPRFPGTGTGGICEATVLPTTMSTGHSVADRAISYSPG